MADTFFGWFGKRVNEQMKKTAAEQEASMRREDEDSGNDRSVE